MTSQKGIDVLIKVNTGTEASPEYTTAAGFRANRVTFSGQGIDATSGDSVGRWREMIAAHGTRNMDLSGDGVIRTSTPDTIAPLQEAAFGTGIIKAQGEVPGLGTFEGDFYLSNMEFSGNHDGEAQYSFTLQSAGEISFTAA